MASVLIVQNEPLTAHELAHLLTSAGHYVSGIAHSFYGAEELARFKSADVALLEYRLAGPITGVSLSRYLRRRGIKVMYVTSSPDEVRAMDAKAEIVSKPYTDQEVLEALERVLGIRSGDDPK